MQWWIDAEKMRCEDIDLREESDAEPMTEEEYHSLPQCGWCDDPGCPGFSAHDEAGE